MKMLVLKIVCVAALVALMSGCGTLEKSRSSDVDGAFVQPEAGIFAVGSLEITSTTRGEESAILKFGKSYKYFQSQPDYDIKIHMTGTNSVDKVPDVVKSICEAFVGVMQTSTATSTNVRVK